MLNLLFDLTDEQHLTYFLVSHDLSVMRPVPVMKVGMFVGKMTREDLRAGNTHSDYARMLFEASMM